MKQPIYIFLWLLSAWSLYGQETRGNFSRETSYFKAIQLFESKQYQIAQAIFDDLKSNAKTNDELWLNATYYALICNLKLNKPETAEKLASFVQDNPVLIYKTDALKALGYDAFDKGAYTLAIKWLKQIEPTKLDTDQLPEFYFKTAYSRFKLDQLNESKVIFNKITDAASPYQADAVYYKSLISYWQNYLQVALEGFQRLSDEFEYKKEIDFYIVNILFKQKKYNQALDKALKLIAWLDNKAKEEEEQKSKSKGKKKRKKKKRKKTRISKRKNKDKDEQVGFEREDLEMLIGQSYFNTNQYKNTIKFLEKKKTSNSYKKTILNYQLGISYYFENNFKKAIKYLKRIGKNYDEFSQHAYFYMMQAYLKLKNKSKALNYARLSSQMNHDEDMAQESYYNYIKLSYEIGNPFESVATLLKSFSDKYPNSARKNEIKNMLFTHLMNTTKYHDAIVNIESFKEMDMQEKTVYQHLLFNFGMQLYKDQFLDSAIKQLVKVDLLQLYSDYNEKADYWIGDILLSKRLYNDAISQFNSFLNNSNAYSSDLYEYAQYNIAYAHYRKGEYPKAEREFEKFIPTAKNEKLRNEAMIRVADSKFAQKKYLQASKAYDKHSKLKVRYSDYSIIQKSICHSLLKQSKKQIKTLEKFIKTFPKSKYIQRILFDLSDLLAGEQKYAEAIKYYRLLIDQHPNGSYTDRARLQLAMTYFNYNRNTPALDLLKQLVTRQKGTAIEQQALLLAKRIYIQENKLSEYVNWVKNTSTKDITTSTLDSTAFELVERNFLAEEFNKTISSSEEYLKEFPNGQMKMLVLDYASRSASLEGKNDKLLQFSILLDSISPKPNLDALSSILGIYLERKQFDLALPYLYKVEQQVENSEMKANALTNLMIILHNQKDTAQIYTIAPKVIQNKNIAREQKDKAYWWLARRASKEGNTSEAFKYYALLEKGQTPAFKAEAIFIRALRLHSQKKYNASSDLIFSLAQDYAQETEWAAKGILLLAKNYLELNDTYQAKYTINTVLESFDDPEIVAKAKKIEALIDAKDRRDLSLKRKDSLRSVKPHLNETEIENSIQNDV